MQELVVDNLVFDTVDNETKIAFFQLELSIASIASFKKSLKPNQLKTQKSKFYGLFQFVDKMFNCQKNSFVNELNDLYWFDRPNELEIKAFLIMKYETISQFQEYYLQNKSKIRLGLTYSCDKTFLFEAVHMANYDLVEYLIEIGVDVFQTDKYGRNAAQIATLYNRDNKIIDLLKTKGCVFDYHSVSNTETDNYGALGVHYMAARGDIVGIRKVCSDKIKFLIEIRDFDSCTILDRAAANGHDNIVLELIEIYDILEMSYNDVYLKSILKSIFEYGKMTNLIDYCFNNLKWGGKYYDETEQYYLNSLMVNHVGGIEPGEMIEKVQYLLQKGAQFQYDNTNILHRHNRIMTYSWNIDDKFISFLNENGYEFNKKQIINLTSSGNVGILKTIESIVKISYDIDIDDIIQPLVNVISNGFVDVLEWLLTKIHDVSAIMYGRLNLLEFAIIKGRPIIVNILKSFGFSVSDEFIQGFKNKFNFEYSGNDCHASSITSEKKFFNENNLKGTQYVILECFRNCSLETLLEYKIPFDEYSDNHGTTAFHVAAAFGRDDLIIWLYLKSKFNIKSTDNDGFNALCYAVLHERFSTFIILKAIGFSFVSWLFNYYINLEISPSKTCISVNMMEYIYQSVFTVHKAYNILHKDDIKRLEKRLIEAILKFQTHEKV